VGRQVVERSIGFIGLRRSVVHYSPFEVVVSAVQGIIIIS